MPRQPYLPHFAHLNYAVGPLVLKSRPALCAAIGKCVEIWGHVDNEMGVLLGILLGTNSEAALEVLLTLRRASNQREALRAAAKHTLQGQDMQVFDALLNVYKYLEEQRNSLAHGCFGISDDDPEILYWIEIKDHVHFQTAALSNLSQESLSEDRHARLKQKMYVFRLSDLEILYVEMEQFWAASMYFNVFLRDPKSLGAASHFRRVVDCPQIAQAISQVAKS